MGKCVTFEHIWCRVCVCVCFRCVCFRCVFPVIIESVRTTCSSETWGRRRTRPEMDENNWRTFYESRQLLYTFPQKHKKTPTPGCVASQWKSRLKTVSDIGFEQREYDWSRICHHVTTRWFGLTPTWFMAGGPTPLGPELPVLQSWLVLNMTYFPVTVPTLRCGWSSRTDKRKMKIFVNVITWWQMSIEGY